MKATKTSAFRARDAKELNQQINENLSRMTALNFQKVTGHLDNSAQIRTLRRDNARIKTLLQERKDSVAK